MQSNTFMLLSLKRQCFECNNIERNILITSYINIDSEGWIISVQTSFIKKRASKIIIKLLKIIFQTILQESIRSKNFGENYR